MSETRVIFDNYNASSKPSKYDDITKGYNIGSRWFYGGIDYVCVSNLEGNAVWKVESDIINNVSLLNLRLTNYKLLHSFFWNENCEIKRINIDVSGSGLSKNRIATIEIYETFSGNLFAKATWNTDDRQNIDLEIVGTMPTDECFFKVYGGVDGFWANGFIHAITIGN